jgi:hypothetical protein
VFSQRCVSADSIYVLRDAVQGIVYVVDCCYVKQRAYNPLVGLESLLVAPTSKVSWEAPPPPPAAPARGCEGGLLGAMQAWVWHV